LVERDIRCEGGIFGRGESENGEDPRASETPTEAKVFGGRRRCGKKLK